MSLAIRRPVNKAIIKFGLPAKRHYDRTMGRTRSLKVGMKLPVPASEILSQALLTILTVVGNVVCN